MKATQYILILCLCAAFGLAACGGGGGTDGGGDTSGGTDETAGNGGQVASPLSISACDESLQDCTDADGDGIVDSTELENADLLLAACDEATEVCNDANGDGLIDTVTELESGTTVSVATTGACANEDDSAIVTAEADNINTAITAHLQPEASCSIEGAETVDAECVGTDLAAEFGFSDECTDCFEAMITCFNDNPDADDLCDDGFATCSGVTVSFADDHDDESSEESGEESGEGEEGGEGEGSEEGGAVTVTFAASGNCVGAADKALIEADPEFTHVQTALQDGGSCNGVGDVGSCISTLVQTNPGLSPTCAADVGTLATCLGGAADTAAEQACMATFATDSGVTISE